MKKILVYISSFSIGDTVASIPYVSKFSEVNPDKSIFISINDWLIPYFKDNYPNLNFIGRDQNLVFDRVLELGYNFNKSVQKGYAEQLGFFDAPYIRPKATIPQMDRPIKNKYISIGVHSTAQLKYWNHPAGKKTNEESIYWNELCGMLRKKGYTPVVVEQHELFGVPPYMNGLPSKSNKKTGQNFLDSLNYIYHSEFYLGLSSGMSWMAHALGKPVAMISNFTEDWNEFDLSLSDYIRITNKEVCHGCWNLINKDHSFDPGDWYWCPRHKDTERQFECHTSIKPEEVLDKIKKWII